MSRGQDERRQRRREEQAAAAAEAARTQARKARLQLALGAVVAVGAIVAAVVVFSGGAQKGGPDKTSVTGVALPARRVSDVKLAARQAGCVLRTYPSEGRTHTTAEVTYRTNPPTSGDHNPVWAQDGIYAPANTPPIGMLVHTLEHGRIDLQYTPGTPPATILKLEALGSEKLDFGPPAYHTLVFQNPTGMPAAVAATAWKRSLTCPAMNDRVYDAVRAFREAYTDQGPESYP